MQGRRGGHGLPPSTVDGGLHNKPVDGSRGKTLDINLSSGSDKEEETAGVNKHSK